MRPWVFFVEAGFPTATGVSTLWFESGYLAASTRHSAVIAMETRVSEVLDRKGWTVHSIEPHRTVYEAIETMEDLEIGALVVVEDDELVGIITERDYLKEIALEGRSSSDTEVATIMTDEVVAVAPNNTVRQCMTLMSEIRARHLPVLVDGDLKGLISIGDCVRQLTLDQEFEIQKLKEFITSKYPA